VKNKVWLFNDLYLLTFKVQHSPQTPINQTEATLTR